jgi:hypothetical protein
MLWITKNRIKKSLESNRLIHDAIIMGVADKLIKEGNLENDEFGLQLSGRALNWAIPNLSYNFENDLEKVENEEIKKRLKGDQDQIFKKGLEILNSDPLMEQLISHYDAYEIYLVNTLFPIDGEKRYPGITRMKRFLFQTTEKEPDVKSSNFKDDYKKLFVRFNNEYGIYGKTLETELIDSLFSFL